MNGSIDIRKFYEGLDRLFAAKDKSGIRDYMEKWLAEAENEGDTFAIISVSNELGGLCRSTGEMQRALKLYDRVLELLKQEGFSESEHFATALINTGDVYINAGKPDRALVYFLEAREMLERLDLAGDYRMAALCNNISMAYRDSGEMKKAEEAVGRALEIISLMPKCRGELATTYTNLGELKVRQGDLDGAVGTFSKACGIFEELGGTDVHYASACAALAQTYHLKGQDEDAVRWYEKALEMIERDFGKSPFYHVVEASLKKLKGN
mgnify:CR=1 FL=1